MKNCFSNATVMWNEREILRRESLVREIPALLLDTWRGLNNAVQMERTETPILTPAEQLSGHIVKDDWFCPRDDFAEKPPNELAKGRAESAPSD